MPQSLIQLPKEAGFYIVGWDMRIRNHKVTGTYGLFEKIVTIVYDSESNRESLEEFEKHKVSYEAVIEQCAAEIENDPTVLESAFFHNENNDDWDDIFNFLKSLRGRKIAAQYIERIRQCGGWGELYEELHPTSKFRNDMKNRIQKEAKQ